MLIAIISDIHDASTNLKQTLKAIKKHGVARLLLTGDLSELASLQLLRDEWQGEIDLIFGNNEWNRHQFYLAAEQLDKLRLHGESAQLLIGGRRIYMHHYPHIAYREAQSGLYDAVFYGHSHQAAQQMIKQCLLLNPGEIQGRQSIPSYAIYDTESNHAEIYKTR